MVLQSLHTPNLLYLSHIFISFISSEMMPPSIRTFSTLIMSIIAQVSVVAYGPFVYIYIYLICLYLQCILNSFCYRFLFVCGFLSLVIIPGKFLIIFYQLCYYFIKLSKKKSDFYFWNLPEMETFQADFIKCWTINLQKILYFLAK